VLVNRRNSAYQYVASVSSKQNHN